MDWIEIVYLICFFLGLGYAIIQGLLSGVFDGGHDAAPDGAGHFDASGHADASGGAHFSPLSPVVLSMFVASFGGTGLILKKIGLPMYGHIPLAGVSGLVIAAIVFYVFWKLFTVTQASSEAKMDDIIGIEAEVITPIPPNGMGEIAYTAKQQRFNGAARAVDNREIPARAVVRIVKVVSNTFFVERTA